MMMSFVLVISVSPLNKNAYTGHPGM